MWQYKHATWYHGNILFFKEIDSLACGLAKCQSEGLRGPLSTANALPRLALPELVNGNTRGGSAEEISNYSSVLDAWGMWKFRQHAFQISCEDPETEMPQIHKAQTKHSSVWLGPQWKQRSGGSHFANWTSQKQINLHMCLCVWYGVK